MRIAGIQFPKWTPYALIGAVAVLVVALCTGGRKRAGETEDAPFRETPFNEYITNDMSSFDGMKRLDRDIAAFMSYWHLRGVSLAVMRHDSLLFVRGYGHTDTLRRNGQRDSLLPMGPETILRLASVSKLVTAIGVMKLKEEGKLKLSDKVFDPETGILRGRSYCERITDKRYYDITVEHLLRHEGGFSQRLGDPMFSTLVVMKRNGLTEAPDAPTLMWTQLENRLKAAPGTVKEYSNFGYFVLSLVIEATSGSSYEQYMQEHVLRPAGCAGFRIAGNSYAEKQFNETRYYPSDKDTLYFEASGSGRKVDRCYASDIRLLQGAGAWVASPAELARLVASVDGDPRVPDILSKESIREMTRHHEHRYSLGWNETDPEIGWMRSGYFSGTHALIKYFPDGECWILVTNTGTWKGPGFAKKVSAKFSDWRRSWSSKLPKQDLFLVSPK